MAPLPNSMASIEQTTDSTFRLPVLTEMTCHMRIVRGATFEPVIGLFKSDKEKEVLERAKD